MARRIGIDAVASLDEHATYAHLAPAVESLRSEAAPLARALRGRTVWMINSTGRGGGVSEMLPGVVSHLRELGLGVEWAVIESEDEQFFQITKRLHNQIHGDGEPGLGAAERRLFEEVNRANAEALAEEVRSGDIVVVHDPQPMPIAGQLRERLRLRTVWRCHIGLDEDNAATRDAWQFLRPYGDDYDHAVFSAPEYVAPWLEGRSTIIYPAVDPLSSKNRPLHVQEVVAVLERSGLLREPGPRVEPQYDHVVQRLQPDGSWSSATSPDDLGLLTRPIVTQVSRWDRLKGFLPLMRAFAAFKRRVKASDGAPAGASDDVATRRRLDLSRLILAGPDPASIADDPEGAGVLEALRREYMACDAATRADIAIVALPMADLSQNALIVNALQRVSTVVVQNSLREGFGLTITEAMWKGVPVLSNLRACGPRQQVRDRVDGILVADPEDTEELAAALHEMLGAGERLDRWGRNAQRRVTDHFLIYSQLQHWIRLLSTVTGAARAA